MKKISLVISLLLLIPGPTLAANPFNVFKRAAEEMEKAARLAAGAANLTRKAKPGNDEEQQALPAVGLAGARTITYAGYSREFLPLKARMLSGDLDGVADHFARKEDRVRKKAKGDNLKFYQQMGFLDLVERGTLDLSRGEFLSSIEAYHGAEQVLKIRNNESKFTEGGKKFLGEIGGMITGQDRFTPYYGVAFERILMLNGKAIAHMLTGDRAAYNVTRRAIDWQNIEKAEFDTEQRRIQKQLEKEKNDGNSFYDVIEQTVWSAYGDLETKAQEVPSAFVNPFGYYMAGMIQEFESAQDSSLIDNARISYGKALELNPDSTVIQQAYSAMSEHEKAGSRRLVHIIAYDGFTPEKKVLGFNMRLSSESVISVKLPIYEPVDSLVSTLKVMARGKTLRLLEQVASVEAISLRNQSDQRAKQTLDVMLAVGTSTGLRAAASKIPGLGIVAGFRESFAAPDMRSWMSLPATISAARFYAPKGVTTIEIVSFDEAGKTLASKSVDIAEKGPTFVFVRSMDTQLNAYANQNLWFDEG